MDPASVDRSRIASAHRSPPLVAWTRLRASMLAVVAALALAACGAADGGDGANPMSETTPAAASATSAPSASASVSEPKRTLLVMGDSLSAGYGLIVDKDWVSLTAQRIAREHPQWRVVNASISGETTAGGATRIGAALERHDPEVVIIELGGNDGLRGLPLEQTRANLEAMIRAAQAAEARVLLIGMRLPPNYGPDYTAGFEANYRELSKEYDTALLPFLLEPIAANDDAFQGDRIHPTEAAQPALRDHVWPALEPLLR